MARVSSRTRMKIYILIFLMFLIFANSYFMVNKEKKKDKVGDFFVITSIFNPLEYSSRYVLYRNFEAHILSFGVTLITVELAFQNQSYHVTNANNPNHIQLRTSDFLWYKENLINIALKQLPEHCKYVAWIDADVEFLNLNWVSDAIYALDYKYKVVQLFEFAKFMKGEEVLRIDLGFGYSYAKKRIYDPSSDKFLESLPTDTKIPEDYRLLWHTGYGWAAKKSTLRKINGLYEVSILGANDKITAFAFIGRVNDTFRFAVSESYKAHVVKWQNLVNQVVDRNLGYVPGTIKHLYHGTRENRKYFERQKILDPGPILFDPHLDLYYDENGLLRFSDLHRDYFSNSILKYFSDRKEDEKQ